MEQEKIEKVIEIMEQNGYRSVDYLDFMNEFSFTPKNRDRYSRLSWYGGRFIVGTTSSHWDTNEVDEFIVELQKHNELAKQLNAIIA
ncbi:hypothetical protein D3C76_01580 [compost metagenome]